MICVACLGAMWAHAWWLRLPPSPDGMVFRVEVPQATSPWSWYSTFALERREPAIAIVHGASWPCSRGLCSQGGPTTADVLAYPSGVRIEEISSQEHRCVAEQFADAIPPRPAQFDFDGDRVVDRITMHFADGAHVVRVLSGHDEGVIFEHADRMGYYPGPECAVPLGDVDGDGFGELALFNRRYDWSRCDFPAWDAFFEIKSWITIVSGSRVAR